MSRVQLAARLLTALQPTQRCSSTACATFACMQGIRAASTISEAVSSLERPRLVVLGTGWAGARLLRDIDPKLYNLTVISTRNHMVFTPLLASTTVGTLEARSVAVHITDIQKALTRPNNDLLIGEARAIDTTNKAVHCASFDGLQFSVNYDKLAICTGSQGSTFGIPGVEQHTNFLRDVKHGETIRNKLIENIALARVPGRERSEYLRLLHTVIVGGGPTGVEVAGELSDFIRHELSRIYPGLSKDMRVTLIEAKELLGSFDSRLRVYAARKLTQHGVSLQKGAAKRVEEGRLTLTDDRTIDFGLCIWSTGVGPTPFITSLPFAKTKMGRLVVDGRLRVLGAPPGAADSQQQPPGGSNLQVVPDVYALGDCCANTDTPLPALAQVAEQQGKYLARGLNREAALLEHNQPHADFKYRHLGSMASLGGASAIIELGSKGNVSMAGFVSWLAWRSAYLTRLGSFSKRLVVAFNWFITLVFGRDMSRW